jgi:hypothetical protein
MHSYGVYPTSWRIELLPVQRIRMVETSLSSNHAHSHLLKLQKGIPLNHIPILLTIIQYYRCGSTMLLYRERKSCSSKIELALPRTSSNWRTLVPI